jgi:TatD DNase family protein
MRLFDTHCHLTWHQESDPVADRLQRAHQAGVRRLISIAVDLPSAHACREIATQYDAVQASVGIHPNDLGSAAGLDLLLSELDALVATGGWAAIGETGLDFFRDHCTPEVQQQSFEHHLAVARQTALPVIIHCRAAAEKVLATLRQSGGPVHGIMHCFSEGTEFLDDFLDLGLHISFAGNVSYPKSMQLRVAAARVPVDRLLIETDAPFLAPQPKRGRRNEPAFLPHTLACLAATRGVPAAELAEQTYQNAARIFAVRHPSDG